MCVRGGGGMGGGMVVLSKQISRQRSQEEQEIDAYSVQSFTLGNRMG